MDVKQMSDTKQNYRLYSGWWTDEKIDEWCMYVCIDKTASWLGSEAKQLLDGSINYIQTNWINRWTDGIMDGFIDLIDATLTLCDRESSLKIFFILCFLFLLLNQAGKKLLIIPLFSRFCMNPTVVVAAKIVCYFFEEANIVYYIYIKQNAWVGAN